jgi:hypothetical protein
MIFDKERIVEVKEATLEGVEEKEKDERGRQTDG